MSIPEGPDGLLASLVERFGPDLVEQHRWFDERDRWVELAHAIAARCTHRPEHEVRAACAELTETGALDRPALIGHHETGDAVSTTFLRHGLDAHEVAKILIALREVSAVLDRDYAGKLQVYLRHCFERMAQEMQATFQISALEPAEVRHALRFWFQNVLGAPLSLTHPQAVEYCEAHGVDWDDLVAAADRSDIHLALLDDMVHAAVHSAREDARS